jgi:hypothetical protein
LIFPGSGAGRSGLTVVGGAGEDASLGGCVTPVASGLRPDSITSLVAGGVTTGATLSGLIFPGSGAGGSTLMAAGGAGEEDVDGGLRNSALVASFASLHHVFASRDLFGALRRDRGFCPNPNSSINSLTVCGATTGVTLSGSTFLGSGAGRSAVLATGGAEEEDGALGNGGATTGAMLFGSGFSVTGSGTGGGGAAAGLAVCRRERTLVLDDPGFAAPGLAGCAAGKRYVFVVPGPPVTAIMFCLAKWFDVDRALFSLRPVALARSLARMVNSGFRCRRR